MNRYVFKYVSFLACTVACGCSAGPSSSRSSKVESPSVAKPENALPTPTGSNPKGGSWPDLSVLTSYPNKWGNTCTMDGTTGSGHSESGQKAIDNEHKNRFVPPNAVQSMKLSQVMALAPAGDGPDQERGIILSGFVRSVAPGGSEGETCNCQETTPALCDAHIELVLDPNNTASTGQGVVIVEVTERSRRLAAQGLLPSNIGTDWSTNHLKDPRTGILHKWVTFRGWLFFDLDHLNESWSYDPRDTIGKANWRQTCWEMHPVMAIQVQPGRPADAG